MTANSPKDIQYLKAIGRICAETLRRMMDSARAGMTTRELDEIGRDLLEAEGARSAPQVTYNFPGSTCISISPVIAHGIPDDHVLREGELIHIDVSAELDGYYADTGASMVISKRDRKLEKLLDATK
ncbi:MAG TPA: M24 family metallopeptidase, partial [Anaerolineales bacterium]|nr:M24 family metallopeptidase [Anaerolineales bacterium]